MSTADASEEVDAAVWCAVAGITVDIPPVNSYVYYFPQGHYENCPSSIRSSDDVVPVGRRQVIPCKVHSVRFYSSTTFDQLFAVFRLLPVDGDANLSDDPVGDRDQSDIVTETKIVTAPTDGVGFSLPKHCSHRIFRPLDLTADEPANSLIIKDTLRNEWTFSHIYGGTPPEYLLAAAGWNHFVEEKQMNDGDSVVFMKKKSTDELFIGIRRAMETTYCMPDDSGSRRGEVLAAIEAAEKGEEFEVVYYPRFHVSPNFVVRAKKVHGAMRAPSCVGMMVRMAVENEGLSSATLYVGTIEAILWPERLPSPWRMLQVTWLYQPRTTANMKRVNPWQVQYGIPASRTSICSPPNMMRLELFRQLLVRRTESEHSMLNQSDHKEPEVGTSSTVVVEDLSPDDETRNNLIPDPVGKGKDREDEDQRNVDNNPPQP